MLTSKKEMRREAVAESAIREGCTDEYLERISPVSLSRLDALRAKDHRMMISPYIPFAMIPTPFRTH
ncbi:MAG: hypothetical protein ACQEQV_10915 [Fibrobacterota bacterium]